jgi:hypothetical protein
MALTLTQIAQGSLFLTVPLYVVFGFFLPRVGRFRWVGYAYLTLAAVEIGTFLVTRDPEAVLKANLLLPLTGIPLLLSLLSERGHLKPK